MRPEESSTSSPGFHRRRLNLMCLRRILPHSRIPSLRRIWSRKKKGSIFVILNYQQVNKMAECLPRICDSMCGNEQYVCKGGAFRLNTIGINGVARLYLEKQYIILRLADLQYRRKCFTWFKINWTCTLCFPDVLSYMTVALTSATYVEPAPNASRHIMYSHLFEELKTLL